MFCWTIPEYLCDINKIAEDLSLILKNLHIDFVAYNLYKALFWKKIFFSNHFDIILCGFSPLIFWGTQNNAIQGLIDLIIVWKVFLGWVILLMGGRQYGNAFQGVSLWTEPWSKLCKICNVFDIVLRKIWQSGF